MAYPKESHYRSKRDERGLTKQQAIFADNVLEVGKEKAAEMAYPDADPDNARFLAAQNLKNPVVVSTIGKLADAKGLTKNACLEAIKKGLDDESPKAYLKAAELGLRIHGELKTTESNNQVPITKDLFVEMCSAFWGTKPK